VGSDRVATLVRELLLELREDPERPGLRKTPDRVSRSLAFLTEGYGMNPSEILRGATFVEDNDEMVVVRDIDIFSLCEHHLLPFYGKCHVAYVPRGRIVGLSKIPRVVNAFSRRLQVQERLTDQIARCLEEALEPHGVAVVIEALHLCMAMRGVEKQNSQAVTSSMRGVFRQDRSTRMEFLNFIQKR
jgi:GTP cyclohydrolase I